MHTKNKYISCLAALRVCWSLPLLLSKELICHKILVGKNTVYEIWKREGRREDPVQAEVMVMNCEKGLGGGGGERAEGEGSAVRWGPGYFTREGDCGYASRLAVDSTAHTSSGSTFMSFSALRKNALAGLPTGSASIPHAYCWDRNTCHNDKIIVKEYEKWWLQKTPAKLTHYFPCLHQLNSWLLHQQVLLKTPPAIFKCTLNYITNSR